MEGTRRDFLFRDLPCGALAASGAIHTINGLYFGGSKNLVSFGTHKIHTVPTTTQPREILDNRELLKRTFVVAEDSCNQEGERQFLRNLPPQERTVARVRELIQAGRLRMLGVLQPGPAPKPIRDLARVELATGVALTVGALATRNHLVNKESLGDEK